MFNDRIRGRCRVKVRVSVVTSGSKKCSVCFTQGPESLGLGERVQVK